MKMTQLKSARLLPPFIILLCISLLFLHACIGDKPAKQPNIIFIYTDQQSETMMSCAGNPYLETPAMDYISENGIRFTRAYTTNPVCSPARVSLMTGRFPGAFNDGDGNQARENRGSMQIDLISEEVSSTTLASFLEKAGYELIYGGKKHLPNLLDPAKLGFRDLTGDSRDLLAEMAAKEIKTEHEKPYFMLVSLINPHDICYMAIRDATPEGEFRERLAKLEAVAVLDEAMQMPPEVSEEAFYAEICPPLPPNYEPQEGEPEAIGSLLDRRDFKSMHVNIIRINNGECIVGPTAV